MSGDSWRVYEVKVTHNVCEFATIGPCSIANRRGEIVPNVGFHVVSTGFLVTGDLRSNILNSP